MNKTKKRLRSVVSILLSAAIIAGTAVIGGSAAEAQIPEEPTDGIYHVFKGSEIGGEGENDGDVKKITKDHQRMYGLYCNGVDSSKVYKVGVYYTVNAMNNPGWSNRISFDWKAYAHKSNEQFGFKADASVENPDKAIIVLPVTGGWREICFEVDDLIGSTIDKVVVATADYNFENDPDGYRVTYENPVNEGNNDWAGCVPAEGSWTASSKDAPHGVPSQEQSGVLLTYKGSEMETDASFKDEANGTYILDNFCDNSNMPGNPTTPWFSNDRDNPDDPNALKTDTVYKAAVYLTLTEMKEDWTFKARPQQEYYYVTGNSTIYDTAKGGTQKVIVVVPFVEKHDSQRMELEIRGFHGTVDKVVVATADYDFGVDQGDYKLAVESVATEGGNKDNYKPADGSWTPSTPAGEDPERTPDTNVYATVLGKELTIDGANTADFIDGDALTLDFYEKDIWTPEIQGLEEGKVYKVGYYYSINHINDGTQGWDMKFMPVNEYYFNIHNDQLWNFGNNVPEKVVVSVPVVMQGNKMKVWQHGGFPGRENRLEKIVVAGADYNFYADESFKANKVVEGVANDGANKDTNKPADNQWTASTPVEWPADPIPELGDTQNDILFYNTFDKADGLDIQGEAKLENGVVTMNNNGFINLGSDMLKGKKDVTIEFVIKPDKIVEHAGIMGLGNSGEAGDGKNWMVIGMRGDGALKFGMRTADDNEVGAQDAGKTEAGVLKAGEWTTVKYVFTAEKVEVYANGKFLKDWDVSNNKTIGEIGGDFVFGKQLNWPDAGFSGSVAELRISTPKDQPTVDKTALEKAITDAKAVYDAAVVGDKPGQYPEAAKTALDAAIKAAEGVASSDADQNAINNAVTELNNAVATFKAAVIPEPGKSDAKDITSFKLGGVDAKIDGTTITAELPAGTDLTNVAAEATVSEKATISPDPATVKDFSKEVKFTVTAEDGSTKEYTVKATVKQEEKPEGTIIVEATGDKYTGGKDEGTVDGTSLTFGPGTGGNREFMCPDLPGLEVGKVYKAAVYLTMSEVAAQDWTIKVRPQHEYYFLTRNDLMYDADKGGDQKVIIVVPFKATSDKANVNCVLEGFTGSIDRVVIATNDYDFGKDQGEYVLKSEYGYQDLKNVTEPTARPAYAGSALADGDPGEKGVGWIPSTIGGEEPDEVNKDALNKAITDAKALFDKAEVGDKAGQYPQAAKDALDQAIKAAQGVADNADADQKAVDEAAATLNKAVETFKAAVIKDTSDPDNNDPDDNNSDVDNNPDDNNTPDDNTPDDNTTPDDNNTPNDNNNPVTGAAGIAMGTLILAAAAGVTLVVSKKRK